MDIQMIDGLTDGQTEWTEGWTDGWTYGWTDECTNIRRGLSCFKYFKDLINLKRKPAVSNKIALRLIKKP